MTVNGRAYRRQLWAPATGEIGGGVLPTPKAADGERGRDKSRTRPDTKGRELATVLRDSLPTPRTCSAMAAPVNSRGNLEGDRLPNLEVVMGRLLPTPTASLFNDGERPETWLARRERVKLTAANGNGMGMPLAVAVKLSTGQPHPSGSIPTGEAMYLNPCFVEEMMGFPVDWTD